MLFGAPSPSVGSCPSWRLSSPEESPSGRFCTALASETGSSGSWRSFPHSAVRKRKKSSLPQTQRRKEASKFYAWGNALDFFFFFKEIESCTSFSINVGLVSESLGILGRIQSPPPSSFCGGGSMRAERRNDATRGSGPASSQVRARLALHGLPLLVDQRPPRY